MIGRAAPRARGRRPRPEDPRDDSEEGVPAHRAGRLRGRGDRRRPDHGGRRRRGTKRSAVAAGPSPFSFTRLEGGFRCHGSAPARRRRRVATQGGRARRTAQPGAVPPRPLGRRPENGARGDGAATGGARHRRDRPGVVRSRRGGRAAGRVHRARRVATMPWASERRRAARASRARGFARRASERLDVLPVPSYHRRSAGPSVFPHGARSFCWRRSGSAVRGVLIAVHVAVLRGWWCAAGVACAPCRPRAASGPDRLTGWDRLGRIGAP